MPSVDEMMKEMKDAIKDVPDDILIQVDKELEDLSKTEGLTGISNLEHMYGIWQKRKGKVGKKNILNSWFAWASGLTKKKPDGEFMEPRRAYARDGFPDIDTDFDDQAAVYQYIIDKYGRENVGNIGTHSTLKLRDCITRLIKSLDIADCWSRGPEEFRHANMMKVDEILGTLPKGYKIVLRDKEGNPVVAKNVRMAYEYCDEFKYYLDLYPQILRHVDNIEGLKSHFGKHASGIVVSDVPLETLAPLRRTKEEGKVEYATQYSLEDLEALGLIKFDVLSIITLRVIGEATRIIKERYDIDVDITNIPLDDTKTLALYRTGNLTGVFQCENPGMQNTMRQIGVDRFDDVVAAIALFRPGPMDSIPEYCARKTGDKRVEYFHKTIEPHVKPYLKDTYGVLVYQEQVMQLCNALAGFSIGDGYSMIKGVGKKKENIINKYRQQFIEGCIANGVPDTVAEQYWTKFITPFASYGFNKSHSCCYGYISWTTAYLKAHFTDEYICANINVNMTDASNKRYEKIAHALTDARRNFGIKVLPKTINDCSALFKIERQADSDAGISNTEIRPGLGSCKGLGLSAAKHIAEHSPYKDLRDLATRTSSEFVNSKAVEALVEDGFYLHKKVTGNAKEKVVAAFVQLREDLKRAGGKGDPSMDIFG